MPKEPEAKELRFAFEKQLREENKLYFVRSYAVTLRIATGRRMWRFST